MRPRVAFLVNPVAGMGGPVALKGSDDREALERAHAEPVAPDRAAAFLSRVAERDLEVEWVTCPGPMGADALREAGLEAEVVGEVDEPTTADDTERLAPRISADAAALVLVGGDGTAADLVEAGIQVPVVGVPSGVKMHSGVFAQDPAAAADLLSALLAGEAPVEETEVQDVDEAAFRQGRIELVRRGVLRSPRHELRVPSKSPTRPDAEARRSLALALVDDLGEGRWILGPGSTLLAIKEELGIDGTPLGVDIVQDGELLVADADEAACRAHADRETRILVSPIGGQGVVLGRGNQPISADVVRATGAGNVGIVATPDKLRRLDALRFDTGDPELDAAFGDHVRVTTGPQTSKVMRVR